MILFRSNTAEVSILTMHLNGLPLCPWVKTGEPFHLHYVNAFFDLFSLALELAPP